MFVSYSSKDKEWVRGELLRRIEDAGLKAFIDFRDFRAGAPSLKECERGVVGCRKTLLILTPNYVASGWTEIENVMAQTLDPANESLRLIPLLKADCQKPLRIGALTHIDFTDGADQNLAWRQLLTALGKPPEPEPAQEPRREQWFLAHPYPMPPNMGFARQSDLSLDTAREKTAPTRDERRRAGQSKQIPVTPSSRLVLAAYRGAHFELAGSPDNAGEEIVVAVQLTSRCPPPIAPIGSRFRGNDEAVESAGRDRT